MTETTVDPTPNVERLQGTLQYIEEHPESHHQSDWIIVKKEPTQFPKRWECGTYACFAGWACLLYGPEEGWEHTGEANQAYFRKADNPYEWVHAEDLARELLGLTEVEASTLFAGSNSRSRLKELVKFYAKR